MSTESNNSPVDPRVQIELEKLNTATDNINKFEVELDEAKCEFKRILAESAIRIKQAAHKLGNSIDAARPYYESRIYAAQLTKETQQAAANYEKAKSVHAAAKEMVYLAEQGLGEKSTLDTACQEMLSHAASKVNQSQLEVTDARNSLKMCQLKLEVANNRVGKMQGQLKQAIKASRPYYETRANYNGLLKTQKQKINDLEGKVSEAKMTYNDALKNLERISEEIHRQRQQQRKLLDYEAMLQKASDCSIATTTAAYTQFPCVVKANDDHVGVNDDDEEYLKMPPKLSTNSSPVRQQQRDVHDCPHLLHDFDAVLTFPMKMHKSASANNADANQSENFYAHAPYELSKSNCSAGSGGSGDSGTPLHDVSSSSTGGAGSGFGGGIGCGGGSGGADNDDNDIEQWTEIRLSHSESTSSSYSNQSLLHEHLTATGDGIGISMDDALSQHSSSSSSDEPKRKVTCHIFQEDQHGNNSNNGNKKQSLSQWLTRSNSLKTSGRRQSLDLLIDAGDRMKDVFSFGFQKVGKSLERRNSESEMNNDGSGNNAAATIVTGSGAGTITSNNTSSNSASGGGGSGNGAVGATEFFLFSRSEPKELLTDEQVVNLLLHHRVDENGVIIVEELKSPPPPQFNHMQLQQQYQQQPHSIMPLTTTASIAAPVSASATTTSTSHISQLATLLF